MPDHADYIERINSLLKDLNAERQITTNPAVGRNLSIAITHLEDAEFRLGPPLSPHE